MEYSDLPDCLKDDFDNLKHGSLTIEEDIKDALDKSKDLEEFGKRVNDLMTRLMLEATTAKAVFCKTREEVVLDAVKFLEWINGSKRMHVTFGDLEKFKTLWDVPDTILPRCVFISGFDSYGHMSHDSTLARIADHAARGVPIRWINIPEEPPKCV